MAKIPLRQIRYNLKTQTGEQIFLRHNWSFFILNTPYEIDRIKQRIIEQLQYCDDLSEQDSGVIVKDGSLHGRLINFKSEKGEIENPFKIYCSRNFIFDRDLKPMDDVDFDAYVDKFRSR